MAAVSRAPTRSFRTLVAGVLAGIAMIGCGDGGGSADAPGGGGAPLTDPAQPPPPINALEIDPETRDFLLTTNRGFFRIEQASGRVTQIKASVRSGTATAAVGTSLELAAEAGGRLIGSGHPDETGTLPEYLGVMTSADGGQTWRVVSRVGEADLHKIVLKHDRIYAFDAVTGALLVSRNAGRTFSEQFTPSGVAIIDLEVDPDNPRRIVASGDAEMYRSEDGGAAWKPLGGASGSRLAWPARDALYRALKDGAVQRSADAGTTWKTVGRIDGEPYRMKAVSREELYVVIGDGTILHTRDGAKTWETAFKP